MPIGWQDAFGDVTGTVELRRRFHKPTNLDPGERVFVTFQGLAGAGSISVNGTRLGEFTPDTDTISYDITKLLATGNLIAVELQIDGDAPIEQAGLWGPVTIEIHPPQPHAPHA